MTIYKPCCLNRTVQMSTMSYYDCEHVHVCDGELHHIETYYINKYSVLPYTRILLIFELQNFLAPNVI